MKKLVNVAEIEVSFSHPVKPKDRVIVDSAYKLRNLLFDIREKDLMDYRESFYLLLVDNGLKVLGYRQMSTGGITSTQVDVRQMLALALKANATGIIVAHNHPSWALRPSSADVSITKKIHKACLALELKLHDHLIIEPWGEYYSFQEHSNIL